MVILKQILNAAADGFSDRLHQLFDLCKTVPSRNSGRVHFATELFNVSPATGGNIVSRNHRPSPDKLDEYVKAIINLGGLQLEQNAVSAWLLYGDAVPNPLLDETVQLEKIYSHYQEALRLAKNAESWGISLETLLNMPERNFKAIISQLYEYCKNAGIDSPPADVVKFAITMALKI